MNILLKWKVYVIFYVNVATSYIFVLYFNNKMSPLFCLMPNIRGLDAVKTYQWMSGFSSCRMGLFNFKNLFPL